MAKSKNINLNLTPENEIQQTLFDDWRQSIDGYNGENAVNPSNFEIVDKEIGDIKEALKHVSNLHFEVVEELPDKSEAKENIIYLVLASESGENNYYEEYIFIADLNDYELIGSTQITFDDVPTKDSPNAVTSGGVYNALLDKQNTIQDLDTIRGGAQKGETAVQPSDLATVATTGSYNDLIDKPEIPEVNNPTITFIQGGNQKGQITLNQTNNQTIEFAGGETSDYSGGNGINIDENNVINADIKKLELVGDLDAIKQLTSEQCKLLNVGDLVSVTYSEHITPKRTILFEVIQKYPRYEKPISSNGRLILVHRSTDPCYNSYVHYILNSEDEYVYDTTQDIWLKENTDADNVHYLEGSSGDVHQSDLDSIWNLGYIQYQESNEDSYFSCNLYISKNEEIYNEESSGLKFNLSSTINSDGEYYIAIFTAVEQLSTNEEEDPIVGTYEIIKKSITDSDVDAIYEDLNLPKVPDPTRTPTYKQIKQLATENQVNSDLINIISDDLGLTELGEEEYPNGNERTLTKQNLLTLKRLVNILLDELGLDEYENKDYPITEDYIPVKDKLSIANPVVEGTEDNLSSLQIGDTKYIVSQGTQGDSPTWLTVMLYNTSAADSVRIMFDIAATNPDYLLNATSFDDFVTKFVGHDDNVDFPASGYYNNKTVWAIHTYDDDGAYTINVHTIDGGIDYIFNSTTGMNYTISRKKITF